mgnify:CR=1 FL=1
MSRGDSASRILATLRSGCGVRFPENRYAPIVYMCIVMGYDYYRILTVTVRVGMGKLLDYERAAEKYKNRMVVSMGKQINYWMDYDSFLLVAQKAVDLGCTIVKEDRDCGRVTESREIGMITPYKNRCSASYYFHLQEAGEIEIQTVNGKEFLCHGFNAGGNAVIEAGFSVIKDEPTGVCKTKRKKEIHRARLYCITGYYDENGEYIPRPECLTKVFDSLVRYVKKIAPYTEIVEEQISMNDEDYGEIYEYRHKEYITKTCLDLVNNEGFKLC